MGKIIKCEGYDRKYLLGGFHYSKEKSTEALAKNTALFEGSGTLLDAGCGDGFWSNILSKHYMVTAEDRSLGGVLMGSAHDTDNLVTWIHGDSRELSSKHDVVFARAPGFLNKERDVNFIGGLEHLLARAVSLFVYISYAKQPFDRYAEAEAKRGMYHHDPKGIEELFSKYGEAAVSYKDGYIWATIRK